MCDHSEFRFSELYLFGFYFVCDVFCWEATCIGTREDVYVAFHSSPLQLEEMNIYFDSKLYFQASFFLHFVEKLENIMQGLLS